VAFTSRALGRRKASRDRCAEFAAVVIEIEQIGEAQFALYHAIPAQFTVVSMFRVEAVSGGLGGFRLIHESVAEPFVKDYGDDGPTGWAETFDLSEWGIFLTREGEQPVGGAAVASGAPVYPLDRFQRDDLAVLWDIRVHPEYRRDGVGTRLFQYAAEWARQKGFGQLGTETQNVNVPACRFYASQGCVLGAIHRFGYAGCSGVADEAMLLWYADL
jgi:GNAT superfamily N-acetyltransferase